MGVIQTLINEIESVINDIDFVTYYRASANEANKKLMGEKTNDCFAFHTDQTTVTGNVQNPGHVYKSYPIEIFFVYKNIKLDDPLRAVDYMVDKAEDIADTFVDQLLQRDIISTVVDLEDYALDRLEAYKLFDAVTSGIRLTWTVPISKPFC